MRKHVRRPKRIGRLVGRRWSQKCGVFHLSHTCVIGSIGSGFSEERSNSYLFSWQKTQLRNDVRTSWNKCKKGSNELNATSKQPCQKTYKLSYYNNQIQPLKKKPLDLLSSMRKTILHSFSAWGGTTLSVYNFWIRHFSCHPLIFHPVQLYLC